MRLTHSATSCGVVSSLRTTYCPKADRMRLTTLHRKSLPEVFRCPICCGSRRDGERTRTQRSSRLQCRFGSSVSGSFRLFRMTQFNWALLSLTMHFQPSSGPNWPFRDAASLFRGLHKAPLPGPHATVGSRSPFRAGGFVPHDSRYPRVATRPFRLRAILAQACQGLFACSG